MCMGYIMELEEYLIKTKRRRTELARAAEMALNKTHVQGFDNKRAESDGSDLFKGPTPQKLRAFEDEVSHQLRKFFSPGLSEKSQKPKIRTYGSVDEKIKETYSKISPKTKKKQLEILPKNVFFSTLRVPERIMQKKNFSLSPDVYTEPTGSSSQGGTKPTFSAKKHDKGDLLLAILKTIGTHEYRSRVYKYK